MAHLTLAGVSDDGKRLLLVSDKGVEFTLDITPSLRAALSGDTSRIGQLEIQMESALRPRDIQARIRAGETPEAVAQAAQTTVDKIMTYAGPVLAEREHVAERAQRSSVRRAPGESAGAVRTLGDAVAAHLRAGNVDPTTVQLGRLAPRGRPLVAHRAVRDHPSGSGTAEFTYDAPGNYVVARQRRRPLAGRRGRGRPRAASRGRPRAGPPAPAVRRTRGRAAARRRRDRAGHPDESASLGCRGAGGGVPRRLPGLRRPRRCARRPPRRPPHEDDDEADEPSPPRRQVQKKRGRASVPSWDEIMFGGGDQ